MAHAISPTCYRPLSSPPVGTCDSSRTWSGEIRKSQLTGFTYAFAKTLCCTRVHVAAVWPLSFAPWGINAKNGLQVVEDLELYFRVTDQIILERLLDERMIEYAYFLERRSPPYNPNANIVRSSSPIFRYPNSIKQAAWHITNGRGSAISDIEKLFYHEGPFFQWKKLLFPYG